MKTIEEGFDWGSASKRDFKRQEMEHELRHEVQQPARRSSAPRSTTKATGMIYHPQGSKRDKNGKAYDFHHGDKSSAEAVARHVGGKVHMFKTLKEFVIEAEDTKNKPDKVALTGQKEKVLFDPEPEDLKADSDQ